MVFRFLYLIILLGLSSIGYCQDIIVKKDSTRTEAKILEVRSTEIKYKFFNYPDGPLYIIHKNDIAYLLYSNGTSEAFPEIKNTEVDSFYYAKSIVLKSDTLLKKGTAVRAGDYIKFNAQIGAVVNKSECNRRYNDSDKNRYKFGGEYYWQNEKPYINTSINIGCNVLLGKSPFIKHVIGINYLQSKGEFNYRKGSVGISNNQEASNYFKEVNYKTKVDFINIVSGLRFRVLKHFYIEPLLGVNIVIRASNILNGTETTKSYGSITEEKIYKDEKSSELPSNPSTVSICPRLSYEFKVKQQILGIYFSYNLSYKINLPWFMAGITYYPFKKLK